MPKIITYFGVLLALKEIRDNRKYTLKDIHDATGLAVSTLCQFSNNKARRLEKPTLISLCNFFECNLSDLLKLVDEE